MGWTRPGLRSPVGNPEKVFSIYCLAVGARKLDRIDTLSEFAAGQLILGLQSGDPASLTASRPVAGMVEGLLNGHDKTRKP